MRKSQNTKPLEPGDRVLIVGTHPWSGQTGTYQGKEHIAVLDVDRMTIQLDKGSSCFVHYLRDIQRLD